MSIYFHRLPIEYLSLANEVILSLEYFRRSKETPEDKDVMLQALSFIKSVMNGELEEKYTLAEKAIRDSLISTGALRVFLSLSPKTSPQKPTIKEFRKALVSYGHTILSLTKETDLEFDCLAKKMNFGALTENSRSEEAINKLNDFFKGLRDLILEQEAVPMEKLTFIQLA